MPTLKGELKVCEAIVRTLLRSSTKRMHNKCNKCKNPQLICASILNTYFELNDLNNEREYRVCSSLADKLKTFKSTNCIATPSVIPPNNEERRSRKGPRLKHSEALLCEITS